MDDLLGIARQLLPLQSITKHEDGSEIVGWLQNAIASAASGEEVHAELSRRVMRLLDEVDKAVPAARNPTDMLGEVVLKYFEGHGIFMGTIVEYDQHTGFRVQYDDGDTEDVSLRDLRALMPNLGGECSGGAGTSAASNGAAASAATRSVAPNPRKKLLLAAAQAAAAEEAAKERTAAAKVAASSSVTGKAATSVSRTASAGAGAIPEPAGGSGEGAAKGKQPPAAKGGSRPASRVPSDVGPPDAKGAGRGGAGPFCRYAASLKFWLRPSAAP